MGPGAAVLKPANLFDLEPAAWVLWHRPTRRHRWRPFATGSTGGQALAAIAGCGEWMLTGEPMYDPNETTLAEVQARAPVPATF